MTPFTPDGEVWTRMHQPADYDRERYAVFPVEGPSNLTVTLPHGRIVAAISDSSVYTIHEDDDGFWTMERYARP